MLGGGAFTGFTKILPGVYDRIRSAAQQEETSTKGYLALAKELDFGSCQKIITAKISTIKEECMKLFGYAYESYNMLWLRECFTGGANTIYVYNLSSEGTKAAGTFATAKYPGTRSNSISITVEEQANNKFEVITYVGTTLVDDQMDISKMSDLKDNDYVNFKSDAVLAATTQAKLSGGTTGATSGTAHEDFLKLCESMYTNIILCTSTDTTTVELYTNYAKTMIEEVGNKTQVLIYKKNADYFGVINLYTSNTGGVLGEAGFLYWLAGAECSVGNNESLTNRTYTGELELTENLSQTQLTACTKAGQLCFHKVGEETKVLEDINSFTTFTEQYNSDFANNQHVRIIFAILIEQAAVYQQKHLGKTQLGELGLAAIYNDMLQVLKDFNSDGCIEVPKDDEVRVSKVDKKTVYLQETFETIVATEKLYIDGTVA